MPRKILTAAAWVMTSAVLLTACNETKTPAPETAVQAAVTEPAVTSAAADESLGKPAANAQAPESATAIQQVRKPHIPQEGEASLQSLLEWKGKYRWDGVDYLKEGVLAQRLKELLGDQYETLLKNLETVGPLEAQADVLYVFGNRQHQGGEESAAVVIQPDRNALRIWLLSAGQQTVFSDAQGEDIPWPESVQTLIKNNTN